MSKPILAIVGRPNVGKSTLFNRLVGRRAAIVEDVPGVTRDRQYGDGELLGVEFIAIDTGGFDPEAEDSLLAAMREQAETAIAEADVVLMVFDGRSGLVPADREITRLLSRSDKAIFHCVNKIDGPRHDPLTAEFWELGVSELWPISAQHGGGVYDLMEAVIEALPEPEDEDAEIDEGVTRVAVVGKPNAGKSTLLNTMLGSDRLMVSDIPGTTRDSIDTWLERPGPDDEPPRRYLMIDTAGVRRRKWIKSVVEKISVVRTFKSIDRAQVCLMVIDASASVTDQDAKLARLIHDKGRAVVMLLNKWDAIPNKTNATVGQHVKALQGALGFIAYAPIVTISALTGQRTHKILDQVDAVVANHNRRVSTSELNKLLQTLTERHTPPVHRGRRLKFFYATQVSVAPPTFVLWVNDPDALSPSYERFIINRLREQWDFSGTPVRIATRQRKNKARGGAPEG